MRILAAILSYYPDVELLSKNIKAIEDHVEEILILENTPEPERQKFRVGGNKLIHYTSANENSISKALNVAWHYAQKHGFDCLLTLDQDSEFINFKEYRSFCELMFQKERCIIGAWIDEQVSENEIPPYAEKERLITSGMIVPVDILKHVGGYYEKFKVDAIDIEFCYRVKQYGYKVIMYKYASTQQQYGQPYVKKVFGHTFEGHNYPPTRLYGIIRNHMIIYRHFGYPDFLKKDIIRYFRIFLPSIIFIEKNKIKKVYSLFAGLISGLFSRY